MNKHIYSEEIHNAKSSYWCEYFLFKWCKVSMLCCRSCVQSTNVVNHQKYMESEIKKPNWSTYYGSNRNFNLNTTTFISSDLLSGIFVVNISQLVLYFHPSRFHLVVGLGRLEINCRPRHPGFKYLLGVLCIIW